VKAKEQLLRMLSKRTKRALRIVSKNFLKDMRAIDAAYDSVKTNTKDAKKTKMGRPPLSPGEVRKGVLVKFNSTELTLIQRASRLAKLDRSKWIRRVLIEAARHRTRKGLNGKEPVQLYEHLSREEGLRPVGPPFETEQDLRRSRGQIK
jgi:hypothetical protein